MIAEIQIIVDGDMREDGLVLKRPIRGIEFVPKEFVNPSCKYSYTTYDFTVTMDCTSDETVIKNIMWVDSIAVSRVPLSIIDQIPNSYDICVLDRLGYRHRIIKNKGYKVIRINDYYIPLCVKMVTRDQLNEYEVYSLTSVYKRAII